MWNRPTPMERDAGPIGAKNSLDGEHRPSQADPLAKMNPLDAPTNREKFDGVLG